VTLHAIRGREEQLNADLGRLRGQVQAAYGELRALSRTISDPRLQDAIRGIAERPSNPEPAAQPIFDLPPGNSTYLPSRHPDSVTGTSREKLGLTLHTVKGYMKSAMFKLHAATGTRSSNNLENMLTSRKSKLRVAS
jgi:hypothetical protein